MSIAGFLARVKLSTRFEMEKMPVANRIWLAKHFSMKADASILSMFNRNSSQGKSYFDYHKASSDQGSSGSSE